MQTDFEVLYVADFLIFEWTKLSKNLFLTLTVYLCFRRTRMPATMWMMATQILSLDTRSLMTTGRDLPRKLFSFHSFLCLSGTTHLYFLKTGCVGGEMSWLYCTCSLICLRHCLIAGSSQVNRPMSVSHPLLSQRTPYMGTKLIEGHSLWGFVLSKVFKFFHYLMLFTHRKWAITC